MFTTIAIVGSGAIGLYYGGRLAEAGHHVRFLLRSDYDDVAQHGIRCVSVHGDFHITSPNIYRSPEECGTVDLVIVAWKATSNHLLEKVLPPLMHEKTQVLTLQNGLGNCETIAAITGTNKVLGGLCFVCINRLSPGYIHHSDGGRMAVGEFSQGIPGRAAAVAGMFAGAKVSTAIEKNVEETVWKKLIWNIPFNGLAIAEGGKTTDLLLGNPQTVEEIRTLMEEVVAAAAARGFKIDPGLIEWNIERTRIMGAYRPSSLIDWQAGREVEINAIWAEPLRRAHEAGLELPHLTKLVERINSARANGAR
jgi:2-dehydropantoate 2-reductase